MILRTWCGSRIETKEFTGIVYLYWLRGWFMKILHPKTWKIWFK